MTGLSHKQGLNASRQEIGIVTLKRIRLELARMEGFPEGSHNHGYEFVAPLQEDGHLDMDGWREYRQVCSVHRFWGDEEPETGILLHTPGGKWVFSYEIGEEDDEPIFRFDRHAFVTGEYVSITEHDGVTRPFRVVSVNPA
ncbi:MAG: hypothetical protein RIC93_02785 [Alphaproteobacteria bacterium]